MPIYEYQCQDCGHQFEILQRMADDPLTDCPQCEHPALTKLVSRVGFQLKGTGWYETDFKHGNKKPAKPAEGDGAGASDKKASGDGAKTGGESGGASGSSGDTATAGKGTGSAKGSDTTGSASNT